MEPLLLSAVLLVFQAPEGWASEPSAAETATAEEGGGHKMTGKERRAARRERRRQRREERRHGRQDAGSADQDGYIEADPDPESEEETEQTLQRGMEKAGGNAQKLGDLLKKSLNTTPEDLPMGKSLGQALGGSLGGGSSGGGGKSGDFGAVPLGTGESKTADVKIPNVANPDPKNKQDLLAAVRSGFGESLGANGLKLAADSQGKATIVTSDGSPAGQDQLDLLAEHISREPVMLTKRPDFFKVLPREKFKELKEDIKRPEPGGEAVFKDVALTGNDRDFAWAQTCGGVSGGCNSYVRRASYRGGDYVEPEDLGQLWRAVRQPGGRVAEGSAPAEEKRVNARSIRARLNVVLGGIKQIFLDTKDVKSGGAGGVGGGSSVAGVFSGMFNWGSKPGKQVVYTEAPKKEKTVVPGQAELASPVAASLPSEKVPAAGMGLGLAVVGLAALAFKRALG